ncbi:hypothetical protein SAMD00079811_83310 (plasmid) [Scytonema sp. HK-05]|uniref:hypothetical protein n=1 Tax=Scytonema sp. HK-05 TaxID=1137095 RepID=UPI0009365217|nr:hypothetical protein [Scytonema sp. HK-05]OKH42762.1 hypothetical protein NIES2130_39545 [Scytonema sp. HK-05]BAY50700.1 hypothetical protein SAMD00079811_83310 [Scytonema sp. HK-05]
MEFSEEEKIFYFQVMRAFLEGYFERGLRASDDVRNILSWTAFTLREQNEVLTLDAAMWIYWNEALQKVKEAYEQGNLDSAV